MATNSFQVSRKDTWFQPNSQKSLQIIFSSRNFQLQGFTKPGSDPKEKWDALVKPDRNVHTLGPSCLCRPLLHHSCHTHHLGRFSTPAYRYTISTGSWLPASQPMFRGRRKESLEGMGGDHNVERHHLSNHIKIPQ